MPLALPDLRYVYRTIIQKTRVNNGFPIWHTIHEAIEALMTSFNPCQFNCDGTQLRYDGQGHFLGSNENETFLFSCFGFSLSTAVISESLFEGGISSRTSFWAIGRISVPVVCEVIGGKDSQRHRIRK